MTNKEFIAEVQKSCHLDMQQCLSLTDNLQKMLGKAAVEQIPVLISGLGVFVSHKHPEYIQEDPQTGAMTLYPPRISYRMRTDLGEDSVSASLLLSEYCSISEDTARAYIDAIAAVVNLHLTEGEEVDVPGIGIFRNVITHQSDLKHISYSPDTKLKELVNTPFSCFEPFVISEGKERVSNDGEKEEESNDETPLLISVETAEESSHENIEDNTNNTETEISSDVIDNDEKVSQEEETNEKNSQDSSVNTLLYVSLALIILGSTFLLWLIFSDISSDKTPQEIIVVEQTVDTLFLQEDSLTEEPILAELVEEENTVSDSTIENKEEDKIEEIKQPEKIIEETKKTEVIPPSKPAEITPKVFHRLLGDDGNPVMVALEPGERLTLLALRQFGDKAFWPYIFEVNTDKLKAPNLVQAGMKLYLPDPEFYHIDANDPESLRKAKNLGAQLQK